MFPITDSSGRVIAFSGRIFIDDGKSAKYLNSPETPIFSKNAVLYGIDKAKDSIRKNNFAILVEGQMDLILSHQVGYRNTVATSGTALSDSTVSKENVVSNLGLIRRLTSNLVLSFDADKAGANATIRAGKIALSLGMDVKVVKMPEGKDPADLISSSSPILGADAWREAIKNSKHIIEFLLNKVLENSSDARKAGREIKEKILPFINALESSIEKTYFIKKISETSGISQNALEDDLKRIEQELKYEKEEIKEAGEELNKLYRKDYIERKLLGIAFWQKDSKILEKLAGVSQKYENIKEDLIFEAEVFYTNNENLEKSVAEMFLNLEEENINEELNKKMLKLKQATDPEAGKIILQEINELNRKKENIKNGRLKK
jgi:DNA primase